MRRVIYLAMAICCSLSLLGSLVGCGGGGSGTPIPSAVVPLSGDYWFTLFHREAGSPSSPDAAAYFSTVSVANNTISASTGVRVSDDGVSTSSLPALGVTGNGTSAIAITDPNGAAFFYGAAHRDGSLALAAADVSVTEPGVFLLVRRGGAHSVGDLQGTYAVGNAAIQLATHTEYRVGTATFDGVGTVSFVVETMADGADGQATVSASYTVASDGAVEVNLGGGTLQLGLSMDRGVLAGVGELHPVNVPGDPSLWIFVKTQVGQVATGFSGAYTMAGTVDSFDAGINTQPMAGRFEATLPTTTAFGSATLTFFHNGLAPGIAASGTQAGGTLQSDANGQIEAVVPSLASLAGAFTPDGRFAFLCGGISAGDNGTLMLLLKP